MNPITFSLRNGELSDLDDIVRLNDSEIPHVSAITVDALGGLSKQAFYFRVAETAQREVIGFALALDERASYSSLNFQWFKSRYSRFVYIDRVVVSLGHQRQGVGRMLYADLVEKAKHGTPFLACEVNLRPPNPGSLEFHRGFGFREVGTQDTEAGKKTVSLMLKDLHQGP